MKLDSKEDFEETKKLAESIINGVYSKLFNTKDFDPNQPRDNRGRWTDSFHNIDPNEATKIHIDYGGSSIDLEGKSRFGEKGAFTVGIYENASDKIEGSVVTANQYAEFLEKHRALFENSEYELVMGTWYDAKKNISWLDISAITDYETALDLAEIHNQIAIFDLENGVEIETGGTGEFVKSLGNQFMSKKSGKKYKGQTSGEFIELSEDQLQKYTNNWVKYNNKRKAPKDVK